MWRPPMASKNLRPCPHCDYLVSRLAEACPSCGRRLSLEPRHEGLFLRTLNQATALVLWGPLLILGVLVTVALIARAFWFR